MIVPPKIYSFACFSYSYSFLVKFSYSYSFLVKFSYSYFPCVPYRIFLFLFQYIIIIIYTFSSSFCLNMFDFWFLFFWTIQRCCCMSAVATFFLVLSFSLLIFGFLFWFLIWKNNAVWNICFCFFLIFYCLTF